MKKIPFAVARAADVAAMEPQLDPDYTASVRGLAVFAGLVVARRGKPLAVTSINADNVLQKLGDPIHPRSGGKFYESIRHVAQALNGGDGHVVRVVPPDMRIPLIRLKEQDTAPDIAPTLVNSAGSKLSIDKDRIAGDGSDIATIAFIAKDANGNLLTGLKNISFVATGAYPPQISATWEIAGTYYAEITSTRAGTTSIIVMDGVNRVGTFTVTLYVIAALLSDEKSVISIDKTLVDAGRVDFATVTLDARDADGNPIIGAKNIDFLVRGNSNPVMGDVVEVASGKYQMTIAGQIAGSMTVYPRQKGKALVQWVAFRLITIVNNAPLSPTSSDMEVIPQIIKGDMKDELMVRITAMTNDGAMIKGLEAGHLTLHVKAGASNPIDPTNCVIGPIQVIASGVYTFSLKSSGLGEGVLELQQDSVAIATMTGHFRAEQAKIIDPTNAKTKMDIDRPRIVNDGQSKAVITATLAESSGIVIESISGLTFAVTKGEATLGDYQQNRFGVITVELVSTYVGDITIAMYQYGVQIGTHEVSVLSAPAPVLTQTTSKISFSKTTVEANGSDQIKITLEANDQIGKPIYDETGLLFAADGFTGGVFILPVTQEMDGSGKPTNKYSSTLTATSTGLGKVRVYRNSVLLPLFDTTITITAVHGKIDPQKCSVSAVPHTIKANGIEQVTITAELKDAYGAVVTGKVNITAQEQTLGLSSVLLAESKTIPGTYTGLVTSIIDGESLFYFYEGNEKLTGGVLFVAPEFERVRGILDESFSQFTSSAPWRYADGSESITVVFRPRDGLQNAIAASMASVKFVIDSTATDLNVTLLKENPAGVYYLEIKTATAQTFNVNVLWNNNALTLPAVKVEFREPSASDAPAPQSREIQDDAPETFMFSRVDLTSLITDSPLDLKRSELYADSKTNAGNGAAVLICLRAIDKKGAAIQGLAPVLYADTPLVDIGDMQALPDGLYQFAVICHSFDYVATFGVSINGDTQPLSVFVEVLPQCLTPVCDDPERLVQAPSNRSNITMFPVFCPADGVAEMTCTIELVDRLNRPLVGCHGLALLAYDGIQSLIISSVVERKPGMYSATVASIYPGSTRLAFYWNGYFLHSTPMAIFSPAAIARSYGADMQNDYIDDIIEVMADITIPMQADPAPGTKKWIAAKLDAVTVGADITLQDDDCVVIYVDDGDDSKNRTLTIEPDEISGFWDLTLQEVDNLGVHNVLERVRFSLDPESSDAAGNAAWLPLCLEKTKSRLRALVRPRASFPDTFTGLDEITFAGGYDGTLTAITTQDYMKALKALDASMVNYTAMLGLGCYDSSVLRALAQHAMECRIDMFADVRPENSPVEAMIEAQSMGLGDYANVCLYHFPYSNRDPFTDNAIVYGLSGDAFTAKARGVAQVPTIGGWHYSPAGYARATILRQNITPLEYADQVDREQYVAAGLNPVAASIAGQMQIDDAITTYRKRNDLQFQHVNSVLNAISRDMFDIMTVLKHEPGQTLADALQREIPILLDSYVKAGALVTPRDTSQGSSPYIFEIREDGFDGWHVAYAVCVVGVARRILCEPVVYR